MTLTAILIILCSLLLLWSGSIQPWFAYLTLTAGLAALIFDLAVSIRHHVMLQREGEKIKAKWSGMFWHGAGLQILPATNVMVFITLKDEMHLKSEGFEESFPLKSVRQILHIRSDQLRRVSDQEICRLLGFEKLPALRQIRAQINRFSRFRRLPLLLILRQDERQGVEWHQLLALYVRPKAHAMNAFLNRPEIREKAVYHTAELSTADDRVQNNNTEVIS